MTTMLRPVAALLLTLLGTPFLSGQDDPGGALDKHLREATHGMFGLTFEERLRAETKYGVNFGKSLNQQGLLTRLRIGADFQPVSWLKVVAMGQDSRVPFYGVVAPNTIRDTFDLHEAYIELGNPKTGFGGTFGRQMQMFGEGRLIGSPQWSNVSRTFDTGRLYYRARKMRLEVLMVSPVKVLPDDFNRPELGERIWGTYDTFPDLGHGVAVDLYALRHSQNRPGGWTAAGTLGTDTFGGRLYGPLPSGFRYSLELVGQVGHIGVYTQRANAYFSGISRKTSLGGHAFSFSGEYRGASGTRYGQNAGGTFDQLSPANHDKFGHEDLFGWRNLRTLRSLETLNVNKAFAVNVMYSNHWLSSAYDSLYNSTGSSVAFSKTGTAGKHVGQELDAFVTYSHGAHLFGAGVGHFFKGEFVQAATSHINPRYFYIFQQYSFK